VEKAKIKLKPEREIFFPSRLKMTIVEFDTAISKKHKKALLAINDRATDMCRLSLLKERRQVIDRSRDRETEIKWFKRKLGFLTTLEYYFAGFTTGIKSR